MQHTVRTDGKLSNSALTAFHDEHEKMKRALGHYQRHVDDVLSDPRLSPSSANFLNRTWSAPAPGDPVTLAQKPCREALTSAALLTLLHHAQEDVAAVVGARRLRLLTTCPSGGYLDYEGGKLPVRRVKRHFGRCMTRRHLEGFGCVDLALVHDSRADAPSELGLHFHGVCRPSILAPTKALRFAGGLQSSARENKHGLAVATVSLLERSLTSWDVAGLAYYVSKISCGLKQEGARATYTSQSHWTSEHALRALEVYSYLSPASALHGVGPFGDLMKATCEARFARFLGSNPSDRPAIDYAATRRAWGRVYQDLELSELAAFRVAL
jgi:hypothetical protein